MCSGEKSTVLGQVFLELDVAVVGIAVDVVGGLLDRGPNAGQRPVHGLVAGDLDRAWHRLARGIGRQIGQFGAQAGGHPTSLWGGVRLRFASHYRGCVLCRIGGKRREACQSGRMGLTANELSALKRTGGSNPLASAEQLNIHAPVAQRIEHLTTDQKVGGSNPFGRTH